MQRTLVASLFLAALVIGQTPRPADAPERELPHFLTLPLKSCLVPTEGWKYDAEAALHKSSPMHKAIDCPAKRGAKVYAGADGWAIQSFHTVYLDDTLDGKRMGFGLGHFVQVCFAGICQSYGHLDRVVSKIPYYEPTPEPDNKKGLYAPAAVYFPFKDLLAGNEAAVKRWGDKKPVYVHQGELLGFVGDTGLSWGYDEHPDQARDHKKQPTWDPVGTHLHFEVYTRNERGLKALRWDPFGIYGKTPDYKTGKQTPLGLFIEDKNGKPAFVRVR